MSTSDPTPKPMETYTLYHIQLTMLRPDDRSVVASLRPAVQRAVATADYLDDPADVGGVIYARRKICRDEQRVLFRLTTEDVDGRSHPRARALQHSSAANHYRVAIPADYLPILDTDPEQVASQSREERPELNVEAGDGVVSIQQPTGRNLALPDGAFARDEG